MNAQTKSRAQPRAAHRLAETLQKLAVAVDVAAGTIILRPDDLICFATQIKLSEVDHGLTDDAVCDPVLAPDHPKSFSAFKLAAKVDHIREDEFQICREAGRCLSPFKGAENRGADLGFGHADDGLGLRENLADGAGYTQGCDDPLTVIKLQRHLHPMIWVDGTQGDDMPRLQSAQIVEAADQTRALRPFVGGQTRPQQQALQSLSGLQCA